MGDRLETYHTNPDEMIGASRPKQNYAMHRQLTFFEAEIRRAESLFSVDRLYRGLRGITPHNFTVNSLKALREVVKNAPPSHQKRACDVFFKSFDEYLEYLRHLAEIFKERIYTVLFEFFYDTSFIRLKDLHEKKVGLVKGLGQGLSPDLAMEVGELCRQLSFNIDGLKDTVNCWQELLGESEIDPNLFDENSAHCIRHFKDCKRFHHVLRLVPDVLNKSRMAVVLARAWWYKAEKIRRKLAGNPSSSDSGVSSSSEVETPAYKPSRLTNRQKASNDNPKRQQPATSRTKVKSLEDMDKERTSYVKKPAPAQEPGNQNKRSKPSDRQKGIKIDPNQEVPKEEQAENSYSFAEKKPKPPTNKSITKMPSIHTDGNTRGGRKARSNNTQTGPKEASFSTTRTEEGIEALSLEPEHEHKEQDQRDSGPLSWQEKKLEKESQKLEELIGGKETQQAALKLLLAMKDNLGREVTKYRGSYRLKRRLQARVALLTEKAHGWKEETKSLDYQHQLLSEDLRLEMRLNGGFYRYNDVLKDRVAYLNDMVRSEQIGIKELMGELSNLKETTDQMLYYGIPSDHDFDEYRLDDMSMSQYAPSYGYRYGALGESFRPYKAAQFLRDEELLLSRSIGSRYERSIWDSLKWESVDSLSLMSPDDSFNYPPRALEKSRYRARKFRKDKDKDYHGDDDLSSETDGEAEKFNKTKDPQMYDLKRDEKQPPSFVPI